MKYRPDVDGLRSLAILPVVLYHAGFDCFSGGFVGVDVFFVISGYLITGIVQREIEEDRFSLLNFYERRARRLLPALTLVVLVSFGIGWFVLLPGEMYKFGGSAVGSALFASNFYFSGTLSYFGQAAEFSPLLHTWSLAVEEQFYLIFPLLLIFLSRFRVMKPEIIIFVLSVFSFAAAAIIIPHKPNWAFYLLPFRAWELGVGASLALVSFSAPRSRVVRELISSSGILCIFLSVILLSDTVPFPGTAAIPAVFGAAILIWVGSPGGGSVVSGFLSSGPFVRIGVISYSLYLWHWPILSYLRIIFESVVLPWWVSAIAVVLALILAWATYIFVERRFRGPSSDTFARNSVFGMSALAVLSIVAVGAAAMGFGGFAARVPVEAESIAAYRNDGNPRRRECFSRSPADGLCEIGKSASVDGHVDFLFWGDSHALALMPGIDDAARAAGRVGSYAGTSACPPVLEVQRIPGGGRCSDFNKRIWEWLSKRNDIPLVILHARWPLSVEGTRFRGEPGSAVKLRWVGTPVKTSISDDTASIFRAGLQSTLVRIVESGRDVVVIGPVPEVGRDVPAALARSVMLGWMPPPLLTREDHDLRSGPTEIMLSEIAETFEQVNYIPVYDLFCGEESCRIVDAEGVPLYRDDDHINYSAAKSMFVRRFENIWQEN